MRLWKYLLIVAVVASGYWTGYAMKKEHQTAVHQVEPPPVAAAPPAEPSEPAVDPGLILPPALDQGVMIDIPIGDIGQHFREKAGLKPPTAPPPPEPVRLPPVVRLPAPSDDGPPPGVRRVVHRQLANIMFVNERELRLNFEVTRRGASGIRAVELWGRRHADQDYERIDRMLGDKPPLTTRLGSEGNYELRLVFESGSGERTHAPMRGDAPDLCVHLDTTPPAVEVLTPKCDESGIVQLRWQVSDQNLDERPVRLDYSVDGELWISVDESAGWLPNTGSYDWKTPAGLPHELHLRVRARDRAGNIGESHAPSRFSIDRVMPDGRISGVVENGPMPRESSFVEFPSLGYERLSMPRETQVDSSIDRQ